MNNIQLYAVFIHFYFSYKCCILANIFIRVGSKIEVVPMA